MVCSLAVFGITFGAVIFIQSTSPSGRWLDAHQINPVRFTTGTLEQIQTSANSAWAKWILRRAGTSGCDVMLESVRYRGQYLDARHDYSVHVSAASSPSSNDWTKWKLTKDHSDNYYLESVRHAGYYLEINYHTSWWSGYYRAHLHHGKSGNSVRMQVHEC